MSLIISRDGFREKTKDIESDRDADDIARERCIYT
jgi:hypothetical protein